MIFPPHQILWGPLIKEDVMGRERRACCKDMRTGFLIGKSQRTRHLEDVGVESKILFNLLKTKRRPLYLKTQSVPRCKHFSSRL
jgi:hypothetical protein